MKVYIVTYTDGDAYNNVTLTLGVYDELDLAKRKCLEMMEKWENSDCHQEITEVSVDEWELNKGMTTSDICKWWRAKGGKYGHFVADEEWINGVTEFYKPTWEEEDDEEMSEDEIEEMNRWFGR